MGTASEKETLYDDVQAMEGIIASLLQTGHCLGIPSADTLIVHLRKSCFLWHLPEMVFGWTRPTFSQPSTAIEVSPGVISKRVVTGGHTTAVSTGNDCARRGTAPVMAPSGKAPILVMASQEGGKIL